MLYKQQECIFPKDELENKLKYWQVILGLEYWDIKIKLDRAINLKDGSMAHVNYVLPKASALIQIVIPEDYNEMGITWPQDMEISLVHELLHVKFAAFDDTEKGTLPDTMMEQTVDSLAKILVTMDRERRNSNGK